MGVVETRVLLFGQRDDPLADAFGQPPRLGYACIAVLHPIGFAASAFGLQPFHLPLADLQQLGSLLHAHVAGHGILNHLQPLQLSLAQFDHLSGSQEVSEFRCS